MNGMLIANNILFYFKCILNVSTFWPNQVGLKYSFICNYIIIYIVFEIWFKCTANKHWW